MGVVLVTGSSSGFGELIALELARRGDTVVATMRNLDKRKVLDDAAAAEGFALEVDQLDVTDDASVRACVERTLAKHGRIDVLMNNAGIGRLGPLEEHADDEILEIFDTNIMGYVRCMRAVLPAMRAQQSGTIVNVTSMAAFIAVPFMGAYAASKAAIEAFSESLHGEVLPFGIRVVTVQPAAYKTPMMITADQPLRAHSDASPYADRARTARDRHLASMAQQDNPQEVAEAVARVIHDEPDALRIVVPAANEGMRGAAASMAPAEFRALVRDIYGI